MAPTTPHRNSHHSAEPMSTPTIMAIGGIGRSRAQARGQAECCAALQRALDDEQADGADRRRDGHADEQRLRELR